MRLQPRPNPERRPHLALDFAEVAASAWRAGRHGAVPDLARDLGLPPASLDLLRVGVLSGKVKRHFDVHYSGAPFTFPMRDARGRVIGIQLRTRGGAKFAMTGSRNGLFLPVGDGGVERVVVTEGQSDTAAAHALGLRPVGLPGAEQCRRILGDALGRMAPAEVILIGDNDDAGRRGLASLAEHLHGGTRRVTGITPPEPFKDLREWYLAGATTADVNARISEAQSGVRGTAGGAQ